MSLQIIRMDLREAAEIAEALYSGSADMTVFQSPEYLRLTGKGFLPKHPFRAWLSTPVNYLLTDGGCPVALAPLLETRRHLYIRGAFTGAGHLNFIYGDAFSREHCQALIGRLKTDYPGKTLRFDRLSEKTRLAVYLREMYADIRPQKNVCVSIPVPSAYDDWFGGLHKGVRQNIRTMYNRLAADQITWSVQTAFNSLVPEKAFRDILRLFAKRAAEYKHLNGTIFFPLLYVLKRNDPVVRYIRDSSRSSYSIAYINGKPAACCCGFVCNDGRFLIPRLSIDSAYNRYSPGGLMISEIMKKICSENPFSIRELDLSRGAEQYKYRYGGIDHYNVEMEI